MRAFAWSGFALVLGACLPGPGANGGRISGALQPIQPALVSVQQPIDLRVSDTPGGQVDVVWGHLPSGLSLDRTGWIRGTPVAPGEVQHFTLRKTDSLGRLVSERSYTLAVDSNDQTLQFVSPVPSADANALTFDGMTWSNRVDLAFAWDDTLDIVWPLRGGATLSGAALAPVGMSLTLVAGSQQGSGETHLFMRSADADIDTVAQLDWMEEADIDLQVLSSAPPANDWNFRREVVRATSPGPEVVSLAKNASPGRYALVATKASGDGVDVTLWLTVHRRDGTELVQRRFDALFSDTVQDPLWVEIGKGRQSYLPLGVIDVAADGSRRYLPPTGSPDPFVVDERATP